MKIKLLIGVILLSALLTGCYMPEIEFDAHNRFCKSLGHNKSTDFHISETGEYYDIECDGEKVYFARERKRNCSERNKWLECTKSEAYYE